VKSEVTLFCQFETLDLQVQEEFEKFLQERGINESLAFFVPEYAQHKEQKVLFFFGPVYNADDCARILGICRLAGQSEELCRCLTNTILAYRPLMPKIYITYTIRSKSYYHDLSPSPLQLRSIHAFPVPSLPDVCSA
jgi:hypothetical protein